MNSAIWFRFAEAAALILAALAALGLATRPRRALARRGQAARGLAAKWLWSTLESLPFPLLALGLGALALRLPAWIGAAWADRFPPAHAGAWILFWLLLLAYGLGEATFRQILVWNGHALPALLRGVLRLGMAALAAFCALRFELGWNVAPLLASTALVTAVVGFALQGVLGNLLAGMSLNLTRSLAPGDWVGLDDLEGRVTEMNWRETWLTTRDRIPIRIPNAKVAEARIRHLTRPVEPRRCAVQVDASYDAPPDRVLAALLAAAAAVPAVRRTPEPQALLMEFKSYGIGYELRIWVDDYPYREPVQAEVRRHVWYQFRRAGIDIPYPVTDQVLNDFMKRAGPPAPPAADDPEVRRRAVGLLSSEFARKVLAGPDGQPLVPAAELAVWAGRLSSQLFGQGETVFRQGEAGDCCYVVLAGRLEGRIAHRETGATTTFAVGPGAVVGEMSLVTGLPRTADVAAQESAELLRIPAPEFAELLGKHAGLVEQISQLVAERAQQNRQQLEDALAAGAEPAEQVLSRDGILRRFWRLLGGGPR